MTPASAMAHDAIVIGGGPAGATAGLVLARNGLRVVVLDRETFPHFHIGESFLPRNDLLLRQLGLREKLDAIAHTYKPGAEFGMGHGDEPTSRFRFSQMLGEQHHHAFNIERAPFDALLLNEARAAGAEVHEATPVKRIVTLSDGQVEVQTPEAAFRGRYLIDASGQGTVVGRHLNIRRVLEQHQKIAYYGHFSNVKRLDGDEAGSPGFAMCREGWMWLIPLNETVTSIGLVMDAKAARRANQPADQILRWAIARCPMVRQRVSEAQWPERNHVCADFSYRCEPFAGPGYFLVGDAAAFIDPIFSTGVCMGMMTALKAAEAVTAIVRGGAKPQRERRRYIRYVKTSSSPFFRMIDLYYRHSFRELFLHGQGPLDMRGAVIELLAGYSFPRPRFAVRWRMKLFELFVMIQKYHALAPRRADFSLLDAPEPLPAVCEELAHDPACA